MRSFNANNVPSDRAKQALERLNSLRQVKRREAKGVSLETCSLRVVNCNINGVDRYLAALFCSAARLP
jgi:hypothetical protein